MANLLFMQQYLPKLSQRTVAYINVDIAVFGKTSYLQDERRITDI